MVHETHNGTSHFNTFSTQKAKCSFLSHKSEHKSLLCLRFHRVDHATSIKIPILMAHKAPPNLACFLSQLLCRPQQLKCPHSSFTLQPNLSCLRPLSFTLNWNVLPGLFMWLSSPQTQFKWHFLRKAFPNHTVR